MCEPYVGVCINVYLYIYGEYLMYSGSAVSPCSFVFLRSADGEGAPEQMWHLNGLLFGKQVAECDRS